MLDRLTNRQVRALCYGVVMAMIAFEPWLIGVGSLMVLLDVVSGQRG